MERDGLVLLVSAPEGAVMTNCEILADGAGGCGAGLPPPQPESANEFRERDLVASDLSSVYIQATPQRSAGKLYGTVVAGGWTWRSISDSMPERRIVSRS